MPNLSVDQRLADLAVGQWGMVTTAQARLHGVARANLAHRERQGTLERVGYGVYRLTGTPQSPLDDLRAAWLSTRPEVTAQERVEASPLDAVVASAAAGQVHGMGDVYPSPYRIIVPTRRQSRTGDIAYSQRRLDPQDVRIVDGLPVTSRERTLLDLLDDEGDRSIVADALRDASRGPYDLDEDRLAALMAPRAQSLGHRVGDGAAVVDELKRLAKIDAESQALDAIQRIRLTPANLSGIRSIFDALRENQAVLASIAKSPALDALRENQAMLASRVHSASSGAIAGTPHPSIVHTGPSSHRRRKPEDAQAAGAAPAQVEAGSGELHDVDE